MMKIKWISIFNFPGFVLLISIHLFSGCLKDDDPEIPLSTLNPTIIENIDTLTTDSIESVADTLQHIDDTVQSETLEELKFLALGDSYTIGASVPMQDRWPEQLAKELSEAGIEVSNPEYIAVTGWTTSQLKYAILNEDPQPEYDLVSLLIGVNNQYRGLDIELFKTEFSELLETAIVLAKGDTSRVFVLSIPDYGVTPFGGSNSSNISKEIDEYNFFKEDICSKYGIDFFNITPISRLAKVQPELLANDNLHPSGLMYQLWVEFIFEDIKELIDE